MPEKNYKTERVEQFTTYDREFNPIKNFRLFATSKKGNFFTIEVKEAELDKLDALATERAKQLDFF